MIAKAVKGKGFRGAVSYDLAPEKGELLDTNLAGETPRELAAEFGAIRALRPTLGKAVLHVSLTAAPGEQLSDDQWREIGQRYLEGMGFSEHQYVLTRHTDTAHDHIHLVANRIGYDGQVVSDSHDYPRQEQLMREIEREYGLQEVAPSIEAERHAPTKGELERTARTGEVSTRHQLQALCDDAAQGCHSFTAYQERLAAVGVEIIPTVQRDGATLSGLQYRLDGVTMKGSDLGKAYAAAGIQKRGISYEQDRDAAAVERGRARAADRGAPAPDRDRAVDPGREAGRAAPAPGGASVAQPVGAEPGSGAGATARAGGSREAAAQPAETQAPPSASPAPAQEAPGVPAPPRRSVEEVARDPDIPPRIAQSPDPAQRAAAQTLTLAEEQSAAPAERPAEEREQGREAESRGSRTEAGTPAEEQPAASAERATEEPDQGREAESRAGRIEDGTPAEEQPAVPAERPAEARDQGREAESRAGQAEAGTPAEEQSAAPAERPAEARDQGREAESRAGRIEAGTPAEEKSPAPGDRPAEARDQGREAESREGQAEAGTPAEEQSAAPVERATEEREQGREAESRESRTEAGTLAEDKPAEPAERPAEARDQGREAESRESRTAAGTPAEEQPAAPAERPAEARDQGREAESQAGRTEAGTPAEEKSPAPGDRPAEARDQGRDQAAPGGAQVSAVSPPSPSRWETIKATAGAWVERVTGRVSAARPEETQAPPAAQVAAPHPPPPAAAPVGSPHEPLYDAFAEEIPPERKPAAQVAAPQPPAAAPVGSPHESLYDAFAEEIPPERKPAAQVAPPPPPAPAQVTRAPEATAAPTPSAEEVARDPDIAKRIAQIQDPVQRAEAQTLLKEVRAEVAAREGSNQPRQDKGTELEP